MSRSINEVVTPPARRGPLLAFAAATISLLVANSALAQNFPTPEFDSGYKLPKVQMPGSGLQVGNYVRIGAFALGLVVLATVLWGKRRPWARAVVTVIGACVLSVVAVAPELAVSVVLGPLITQNLIAWAPQWLGIAATMLAAAAVAVAMVAYASPPGLPADTRRNSLLSAGTVAALAPLVLVLLFPAALRQWKFYGALALSTPVDSWVQMSIDVGVFAGALAIGTVLVFFARSRRGVFMLMVFAIAYFGFWRQGCVCAVGSIQNVSASLGVPQAILPIGIAVFFALPLILALFYGRVFCAGVCPLGTIQDVFLWKPVQVPNWLEQSLGLLAYAYLGLGVMFAAVGSDFLICRYDPFVALYRLSGPAYIFVIAGVLLVMSMFIGRTYCRFLCPYSVLLRWLSPFSMRRVTITPTECVDCRLCETSCPFGAIRKPTPPGRTPTTPADRQRLTVLLGVLPGSIAVAALLGWLAAPVLSKLDPTVSLSQQVLAFESRAKEAKKKPAELIAQLIAKDAAAVPVDVIGFYNSHKPVESLYERADKLQARLGVGAAIFGGYLGAVVVLRLIANSVRRRRTGYTADPAACVACARCYMSCPVELERRGLPLPVAYDKPVPAIAVSSQPKEPVPV